MNVENVLSIKCTTLFVNNGILCVKFRYRRRKETNFKSNADHAKGIAIVVDILECFKFEAFAPRKCIYLNYLPFLYSV